jgi:hypothetical protein
MICLLEILVKTWFLSLKRCPGASESPDFISNFSVATQVQLFSFTLNQNDLDLTFNKYLISLTFPQFPGSLQTQQPEKGREV